MTKLDFPFEILCVDDEPDLLQLLRESLEPLGYTIRTASGMSQALEVIKARAPFLAMVLSDYAMPDGNGFELRRRMMADHKQIPFVIVSGHVSREMALSAVELQISSFVNKPFDPQDLHKTILEQAAARMTSIKEEDELLKGFIADAENLLEEMEELLLRLEGNPQDNDAINRVFACAHTIKGASGFFKPDFVHRFTHKYEDYFAQFKRNPEKLGPGPVGILLQGLDTIRTLLASLKARDGESFDVDGLALMFIQHDSIDATNPGPNTAQTTPAANANEAVAASGRKGPKDLRVGTDLLDQFMELSGEITVIRNMINKLVRSIEKDCPANKDVNLLGQLLGEMHKINSHMQEQVIDIRKVPLAQVFKPLNRTVRDLCASLGKEIQLELQGENLRVDNSLAELLSNSLIHMVRNSADHGIEAPEKRTSLGKPTRGTISIEASEEGESVIVKVADDGKGLDVDFLRRKVVEKGLRTQDQVHSMTASEIRMMIFEPGFSTAAQVTAVSGRGVGTDMVKKSIDAVGGSIEIQSEVGKGTLFVIRLPIPKSVTIISSLLVRVKGETFAIPQDALIRLLCLDGDGRRQKIQSLEGTRLLESESGLIPVVSAREVLGYGSQSISHQEESNLVLMRSRKGAFALEVDEILDTEDTVVKKLTACLKGQLAFGGATFLGDGRVGLILSPEGIAAHLGIRERSGDQDAERRKLTPSISKKAARSESWLIFALGGPGRFAVRQQDIQRIEELPRSTVQYSGRQPVVVYRGRTVPIHDLSAALELEPMTSRSEQLLLCLIFEHKGMQHAFSIREIFDLRELSADQLVIDRSFEKHPGTLGAAIIDDATVTVIDPLEFIEAANPVDSDRSEESRESQNQAA